MQIKFEANPKPTTGTWKIHGLKDPLAIGAESLDKKFKASVIQESEGVPGEYLVTLTIKDLDPKLAGKTNTLTVQNDEGSMEYKFELRLGEKPPAGNTFKLYFLLFLQ